MLGLARRHQSTRHARASLSAAPIPQFLSLHFAQLNIKASKHFSSSAQRCLPNYLPAGLSYRASCFPGCWQPLAYMPVIATRETPALRTSLPTSVCSSSLPWDYLGVRYPKAVSDCLSLFKLPERAVCSSKAVLRVLTRE